MHMNDDTVRHESHDRIIVAKKPSLEFYCLLPVMFWFLFFTKFYPWFFRSIFARKCVLVSDLNCTVNGSTNDVQKTLKHKVLRVWVQGTCTSRLILRYITKKCVVVALIFISYGSSIYFLRKLKVILASLKIAYVVSFNKARFLSTISRFIVLSLDQNDMHFHSTTTCNVAKDEKTIHTCHFSDWHQW